jgi:hypothetical protein
MNKMLRSWKIQLVQIKYQIQQKKKRIELVQIENQIQQNITYYELILDQNFEV